MPKTLQEHLARKLHDSVERLQQQAENVEFWASAVTGLAQPVPDYTPEETAVSRYIKPARSRRRRRRRAANQNNESGGNQNAGTKPASA